MAFNSYKEDEQSVEKNKLQTLKRLFSYLLNSNRELTFCFALPNSHSTSS